MQPIKGTAFIKVYHLILKNCIFSLISFVIPPKLPAEAATSSVDDDISSAEAEISSADAATFSAMAPALSISRRIESL